MQWFSANVYKGQEPKTAVPAGGAALPSDCQKLQSFDAVRAQQWFICVEWCRLPEQTAPAGSRRTWLSGARVERRLAAISAADAAGCSRLMGEDNAGPLVRLAGVARAMCDVSDELVDLGRICDASELGIVIDVTALPLSPPASRIKASIARRMPA